MIARSLRNVTCATLREQANMGEGQALLKEGTQRSSLRHGLELHRLTSRQLCNHVRKHLQATSRCHTCIQQQVH